MNTLHTKALTIATVSLLGTFSAGAAAQENDYSRALRELNIMNNIFEATLEEERGEQSNRPRVVPSLEAIYLAGQGMVFTFNVNNPWNFRGNRFGYGAFWQDFGEEMARIAEEVATEVRTSFPDFDFDFDFDFDSSSSSSPSSAPNTVDIRGNRVIFGYGPDAQREALEEQREAMEDMREAIRDRQENVQDLQRDLQDLRRQISRNRDIDIEALEERIASLEEQIAAERAEMEERRAAYEQFMNEYQSRVEEEIAAYNRQFTNMVASTLCDYGATLRSLEDGEHVTAIFENYSEDGDQVYVFDYADVAACESADALLQNAVSYQL